MTAMLSKSMQSASRKGQIKYAAKRKGKLLDQLKAGTLPKQKVKLRGVDIPFKNAPKRILRRLQPRKPLKRRNALKRVYKPTGELALFRRIYEERGGRCEITGLLIPEPKPHNFLHVLSKKAYPAFRLNPQNILLTIYLIHFLYDNSSKEKLLKQYPKATIIFEKKQILKQQYYAKR